MIIMPGNLRFICYLLLLMKAGVLGGDIGQLDSTLTTVLQGHNRSPLLDLGMESLSLASPIVEIGWIAYWAASGEINDDPYAAETGSLAAGSYLLTNAVSLALKYTLRRERPARSYRPRLWNTRITPSFPSGHTASSAAWATVAAARYPQHTGVILIYAALSAYSQVYTGNHYLGDVLAGTVLGSVVSGFILGYGQNSDPAQSAAANLPCPAITLRLAF
jgi:membrane-associated phospholipid phosphatase